MKWDLSLVPRQRVGRSWNEANETWYSHSHSSQLLSLAVVMADFVTVQATNYSCDGGGLGLRLYVWHICLGPTNNKPSGNSAALRLSPRASRASFRASLVTGFVELLSHSRTTLRRHTWALPSSPVNRAPIVSNSPIGTSSSIPNSFHFDATGIKSLVKQSSPGCSMQKRYWGSGYLSDYENTSESTLHPYMHRAMACSSRTSLRL